MRQRKRWIKKEKERGSCLCNHFNCCVYTQQYLFSFPLHHHQNLSSSYAPVACTISYILNIVQVLICLQYWNSGKFSVLFWTPLSCTTPHQCLQMPPLPATTATSSSLDFLSSFPRWRPFCYERGRRINTLWHLVIPVTDRQLGGKRRRTQFPQEPSFFFKTEPRRGENLSVTRG